MKKVRLPQNPIFIVGYPRSGTTLLQAILASQEGVFTLPETHFFNVIYKGIEVDEQGKILLSCLKRCFRKIREKMNCEFSQEEAEYVVRRAIEKKLQPKDFFEFIVSKYIYHAAMAFEKPFRWLEKTPNHAYFLEQIVSYYPKAQFVNILRHPLAAIASRKRHFPYNKDTPTEKLVGLWMRSVESIEEFENNHPGKSYTLKYEKLVATPVTELSKLGAFLDLDITLDDIKKNPAHEWNFILPWETWKEQVKVNEIVNGKTSYTREMGIFEILKIQPIVQDKMQELGYDMFHPLLQKGFNLF